MTDPASSATTISLIALAATGLIAGVDPGILAGAFAGAILFTLRQPNRPATTRTEVIREISLRLVNFCLSWAIGYWAAPSTAHLLSQFGINASPPLSALIGAAGGMLLIDIALNRLRQQLPAKKEPTP